MPARKRRALVIAVVTALTLLGTLVPATPAIAAANLLANPGFEYGDSRFWSNLRADVVTGNARSGQHAVRLSADETSVEQVVDVLPSTSYTVSGWAMTDSREVWIGVKNFGGVETNVKLTSTTYARGTFTFTTGPNARSALIYFFKYSVGNTAYGDDFEVVPTASLATDRVVDGGFENGPSPWAPFNAAVVAEQPRTGRNAARLSGPGDSAVEQTVTGLSANTTYTLTGWAKTNSQEAWIGVKHYGGTETNVKITSPTYVQGSVRFTTGPTNTTARIYFFKHTAGNTAYGDDFTVTPTPAEPPQVWTENSLVSVFKDSQRTAASGNAIELVAARNEYEFGQLALRSNGAFDITSVTLPDLLSGSNRIAASNLRSKYVDYAFIANSSPGLTNTARTAPAYFPEYLRNDVARSVPGNTTQPISVTVFVPPSTPAGTYRGTATVNTTAGNRAIPIEIEVADVTLPDAEDGAFSYANYTFLFGFQGEPDQVARFYPGIRKYSDEWWALMGKFADDLREHRMNVQWVPTIDLLFDAGSTVAADGTVTFDWDRFDEVVGFLLRKGVTKRLLGECFLLKRANTYDVWGLANDNGQTVRAQLPFGGQAEAFARQYLSALKSHLVEKGWWDEWWMTLGDEPQFESEWSTMRRAHDELIEPYAPGMRLTSPHFTAAPAGTFEGRLSVYVPQLDLYASNPAYYRARQAAGDEVWTYVCQVPRGDYFNRFIELPLARSRFLQWYNFGAGVTGTLHWAYSNWKHGVYDPGLQVPPGDTTIVWPDPINNAVMGTLRHDATRDGIEEYELLAIIARTDPARARQLATAVAPGPTMGQHDPAQLQLRHNELVRAAAGPQTGR